MELSRVEWSGVAVKYLLVVSVPVLSEQMAVALPIVSHASRWRTRLLSYVMRCAHTNTAHTSTRVHYEYTRVYYECSF